MGKRAAAPVIDTRPRIVRVAVMVLGIVLLAAGALAVIVMAAVLVTNGTANFDEVGHTNGSAGGAILGIATVCAMAAFVGWRIFLNGRYGPQKKHAGDGMHRTPRANGD